MDKQIVNRDTEVLEEHHVLCDELKYTYERKNADYGNSFSKARKIIPNYTLGKLYDKFSRYSNLVTSDKSAQVDESIMDTLLDMANYCIMEVAELVIDKADELENTATDKTPKCEHKCRCENTKEDNSLEDDIKTSKLIDSIIEDIIKMTNTSL